MSYQVLARKYRPKNFESLVGQEHVKKALTHALREQRLHHAYLLTGTRGVGKTTIARILAKSLNCETGVTPTPCEKCSTCQEINSGRFVDLLEVDAATNTRVEEMRQLLENAVYAPTKGRFKVYVIDEVHMLSTSAFNAMLKTLEEPPEHVKFILATTDPQKIPVTVLSRCLQFNLKAMPVASIVSHLTHILELEKIPFEASALNLIARSGNGSMRDSLSLLDQAIAHGAGEIKLDGVRTMLGTVDKHFLLQILQAICQQDVLALMGVVSQISALSLSFLGTLQELGILLTKIQVLQCLPPNLRSPEELAKINIDLDIDDEQEKAALFALMQPNSQGQFLSPEFVSFAYQIINLGRKELAWAPDEESGFTMTLLRLFAFSQNVNLPTNNTPPINKTNFATTANFVEKKTNNEITNFHENSEKIFENLVENNQSNQNNQSSPNSQKTINSNEEGIASLRSILNISKPTNENNNDNNNDNNESKNKIENESENDDSKIINISENLPKQSIKNVVNQENSNENKFAENKPQENDEFVDFLIQELNAKIL